MEQVKMLRCGYTDLEVSVMESAEVVYLKYWLGDKVDLWFFSHDEDIEVASAADVNLAYILNYCGKWYTCYTCTDPKMLAEVTEQYIEASKEARQIGDELPRDYLETIIRNWLEEDGYFDDTFGCPTGLEDWLTQDHEVDGNIHRNGHMHKVLLADEVEALENKLAKARAPKKVRKA